MLRRASGEQGQRLTAPDWLPSLMALSVYLSLGFFFLLGVGGKHWNTHVYNVTATDYKEAKFKLTANVFSFPVSLFVPSACPMRKGKKKRTRMALQSYTPL